VRHVEAMVDPARLAELKTRAAHSVADAIRGMECDLALGIETGNAIEDQIVRSTISDIWTELIRRDYDHLVED